MSKKYREIMDQVRVTDEMKQRVLQNIDRQMGESETKQQNIISRRFWTYGKTSRYLSVAACLTMLIVGGLTVPKLLHRGSALSPSEPMVGAELGETMVGFGMPEESGTQGEEERQVGAMAGNGMEEMNSLQELSQALGFAVPEVGAIPFAVQNTLYVDGWNEFAQVSYQGENEEVAFRKAKGEEDISGDFREYTDIKEVVVGSRTVTLKGNEEKYSLAVWLEDGFSYSLSLEPGGAENILIEMIQTIQ